MHRLPMLLLLFTLLVSSDALAQSGAITVICTECRDPHRFPADWANHAFNQVFGEDGWMTQEQADDFFLVNLRGDRVYVDIDFVMTGINVLGQKLPLWPTNTVKITLALPNGTMLEFLRSVYQSPLPVPSPPGPSDSPGVGAESGNDGVDDEPSELPEIEEIPEIEWCEEC